MVDVADSKSAASDGVPVRVRSPAPIKNALLMECVFIFEVVDSNPLKCDRPVDTCLPPVSTAATP